MADGDLIGIMSGKLYIGTSGYKYNHWRKTFYPEGTKIADEFAYYRTHFNVVEINYSFYRLPSEQTLEKWRDEVTDSFSYVLKASRFITHTKRLQDPEQTTMLFFDRTSTLGDKIGCILFQLPPSMKFDADLLRDFLAHLPKTYRYAFEFRHPDWYRAETYDLLKKYNCAFCIYELNRHQSPIEVTADFA